MTGLTHLGAKTTLIVTTLCLITTNVVAETIPSHNASTTPVQSQEITDSSTIAPPKQDGWARVLAAEGADALHRQDYAAARLIFEKLVAYDPTNRLAHRSLGRSAFALADHEQAAKELQRAHELRKEKSDPELHYLLGESLYALGRPTEARGAHEQALSEIPVPPQQRIEKLWLGRIYARRGEFQRARSIYLKLTPSDRTDEEVMLNHAEAYLLGDKKDWKSAEEVLRDFLNRSPKHQRGQEMLAWVLEAQHKYGEERSTRKQLAGWTGATNWLAYARSLERTRKYQPALKAYRQAQRIPGDHVNGQLQRSIDRMRYRMTMEVGAGATFRSDPTGSTQAWHAGATKPIHGDVSITLLADYETTQGKTSGPSTGRTAARATLSLGLWKESHAELSFMGGTTTTIDESTPQPSTKDDFSLGTSLAVRSPITRFALIDAKADFHSQWLQSASTIRSGGHFSGVTTHLYLKPFGEKIILSAGGQARWFDLSTVQGNTTPTGSQLLIVGGGDAVVWSNPRKVLRGEILSKDFVRPTYFADAFVLGYRHYEAFSRSTQEFADRVPLVRASIDELSFTGRKVLGRSFGLEGRAGIGRDWKRDLILWRAAAAVDIATTKATRIRAAYEQFTERTDGLAGKRHEGWVTFHVEL